MGPSTKNQKHSGSTKTLHCKYIRSNYSLSSYLYYISLVKPLQSSIHRTKIVLHKIGSEIVCLCRKKIERLENVFQPFWGPLFCRSVTTQNLKKRKRKRNK